MVLFELALAIVCVCKIETTHAGVMHCYAIRIHQGFQFVTLIRQVDEKV